MPSAERWPYSSSGTSSHVITWTPFIASALLVSRFVITALCTGERKAFTQSVPGIRTSSTNTVCPVTWATPS